jgi:hypothetical protein
MTDQYLPPAPDQHDTAAFPRPLPPQARPTSGYAPGSQDPAFGAGAPGWYVPDGQPLPRSNPEADYWAARYRNQRTWTRVLAGFVVLALIGVLGLGIAAWQFATTNPLVAAASDLADGLGTTPQGGAEAPGSTTPDGGAANGLEGLIPEGLLPEGALPEGALPEGALPEGATPDGSTPNLSELPLPESLQDLAGALGITDVGQLLDLAVANGLLSPEDADQLRAALEAGAALPGLAEGAQ